MAMSQPEDIQRENTSEHCPCCGTDGWLGWYAKGPDGKPTDNLTNNGVVRCHCVTGADKNLIAGLCDNVFCQNKGKLSRVKVPPGWHYKTKKMMQNCIYSPSVTEQKQLEERQ